jgi:hypothetical protein
MCVTAHAVAVVTTVSEPKVFPWAVLAGTKLPPYSVPGDPNKNCLGDPAYCLELTTTNSGVLDFTCARNSRDYSYWWRWGFGTRAGEPVPTVRTNWTACGGPAQDNQPLQAFLDQVWGNMPESCHWDPPQPNFQCPLMGMLPIVKETKWPGGSGTVTIVDLVPFKMLYTVDDGNGRLNVVGHIIKTVDGIGPGGVGQTQLPSSGGTVSGPTGIRLIQ